MTVILSQFAQRTLPTVNGDCAGDVVINDFFIDLKAAQIVNGDIIDIGSLPAFNTVVDAILISDDLDAGGSATLTLDVGIMSGEPGSADATRTCGKELFDAATVAQAGGVVRMSAKTGFLIKSSGADRSIGVKFSAAAATAQAGRLRLRVLMAASDQNTQF